MRFHLLSPFGSEPVASKYAGRPSFKPVLHFVHHPVSFKNASSTLHSSSSFPVVESMFIKATRKSPTDLEEPLSREVMIRVELQK